MSQPPEENGPAARPSDAAQRHRRPRWMRPAGRDLSLAVASAVVLAIIFFVVAFVNPWALVVFVSIVVVIAMLEVDVVLRTVGLRPPSAILLVGGVVMMVAAFAYGPAGQLASLALTVLGVVLWSLADPADAAPLRSASGALMIGLWVPFLASFLSLLLRRDGGDWYVVMTVVLTSVGDIAAYGFGSQLGRHKLAPAVSPGKSWEGFAGSVITTMIVAAGAAPLIIDELSIGRAAALGVLVVVVGTVGDLAESAVKRSLGIKDFGRLLPGHGGMMDRIDAMLFTLPVAHLVLLAGRL